MLGLKQSNHKVHRVCLRDCIDHTLVWSYPYGYPGVKEVVSEPNEFIRRSRANGSLQI
jgi:hypothetical protein